MLLHTKLHFGIKHRLTVAVLYQVLSLQLKQIETSGKQSGPRDRD